ncbi:MAG: RNA methyltransferase, partial [Lachnospiraceae bacterium]|nr:RNA methyltransferase [Lachnospiraceae bacterium]
GRGIIPEVKEFMTFKQAIEYAKTLEMNIIPYEEAEGMEYSREVIKDIKNHKSLGIFIGPEGGFAKEEVELAMSMGAKCITLGNRILRTETAGLAVLSIIMFEIDN